MLSICLVYDYYLFRAVDLGDFLYLAVSSVLENEAVDIFSGDAVIFNHRNLFGHDSVFKLVISAIYYNTIPSSSHTLLF